MVADRIAPAELVVGPEREIGERPHALERENLPQPRTGREDGVGEDRAVIEMETGLETSAKGDDHRDGKPEV